jgi:uncharacterized protein (DUF58 family)
MEVQDLIKKVRQIEIKTKKLSSELFSGNYNSNFKGRGMSFAEVRAYTYGDDVRNIDWNVTSRNGGEPYIKEFEEERELTFMILVDVSASMDYGSKGLTKKDVITEIAATLAFSALKNSDKVGVVFFSDRIEKYIPPKKGKSHILRIIRELIETKSDSEGTDIGEVFRFLQNTIKKKTVAFLLSDFLESKEYQQELSLISMKHQIFGVHINDPTEHQMPNIGMIQIFNPEKNNLEWLDTSQVATLSKNYFENVNLEAHQSFKKLGLPYCSIHTQESFVPKLASLFRK